MKLQPDIKVDPKTGKPSYVGFKGSMSFRELGNLLSRIGRIFRRKGKSSPPPKQPEEPPNAP